MTPSGMIQPGTNGLLDHIEIATGDNPQAAIIWMHGLGATAHDFVPAVHDLDLSGLPAIRFIFPQAPHMPVTLNSGYAMPAWFDLKSMDFLRGEDEAGLCASQRRIEALIEREKARGIPAARIVLAGFSQGSVMTFQTGLRHPERLAGLLCLSGWVALADRLPAERSAAAQATPIFMAHGTYDNVVPFRLAERSRDLLTGLGYEVEWHAYEMPHAVHPDEYVDVSAWLKKVLG